MFRFHVDRLALRYDSGSSVTPPLHLRSLKLIFYLPDGIHEFAQGLHGMKAKRLERIH